MYTKFIVIVNILLVCGLTIEAAVVQSSPWEHTSDEIGASAPNVIPGTNPLVYTTGTFSRERELYGYYPRFKPNMITFDYDNRPYIYVGKEAGETPSQNTFRVPRSELVADAYIQTLNDDGQWVVINLNEISKTVAGNEVFSDFNFYSGDFSNVNRVAFDNGGNLYFTAIEVPVLNGMPTQSHYRRIFSSNVSDLESWLNTTIYNGGYVFEAPDAFTSDTDVPSLLQTDSIQMKIIPITKSSSVLTANAQGVLIGTGIQPGPLHSGIVNAAVTLGDIVHIVWLDCYDQTEEHYTKQYYTSYNRKTGVMSDPVYLGSTYGNWLGGVLPADTHNGPAITVDKDRTIHVVLGAHGSTMKYTHSADYGKTWAAAVDIADSATYPSLCATPDGSIHMIYRKSSSVGGVYKYRLWYAKKEPGYNWQDMGCLVEPYRTGYSIYYHKLTSDRKGNLYLSYSYLIEDPSSEETAEYTAKWPNEDLETNGMFAHDRSVLTSNDNGASWHLATTSDFVDNITSLVAYYSFDQADAMGKDYSGNENNLQANYAQMPAYTGNGSVGGAAIFNGVDQGFDLAVASSSPSIYPKGSFTVTMWVKPDTAANTDCSITMPASTAGGYGIHIAGGTYRINTYTSSPVTLNTGVAISDKWTHLAVVFDADGMAGNEYTGTIYFYADGDLVLQNPMNYKPDGFRFGLANRAGGSRFYKGMIDEVAIFNGVVLPSKIALLAADKAAPNTVMYPVKLMADLDRNGIVDKFDMADFASHWLESDE